MHFKVRAQKYILIDENERIKNLFLVMAMNYQVLIDTALVVVVFCAGYYFDSLPHILNHPQESFFLFSKIFLTQAAVIPNQISV